MSLEDLIGTFELLRNENMNKYLSQSDVPFVARKMMMSTTPHITIRQAPDGLTWGITTCSAATEESISFKHGEGSGDATGEGRYFAQKEFVEKSIAGNCDVRSVAFIEGNAIKITSTCDKGHYERTLSMNNGDLVLHLRNHTKEVEAKRFFKRLE